MDWSSATEDGMFSRRITGESRDIRIGDESCNQSLPSDQRAFVKR